MDTQIGDTPETEGEWAVDRILSHVGSRTDSTFEIKWKSRDITWLPYYQITHLQALTNYFDLLGVSNIRALPRGVGRPPQDDPQTFLGAVSIINQSISHQMGPITQISNLLAKTSVPQLTFPDSSSLCPSTFKSPLNKASQIPTPLVFDSLYSDNHTFLISTTSSAEHPMPPPRPALQGVDHPLLMRVSPTIYLLKEPGSSVHTTVHVAQIAEYVQFDEELRAYSRTSTFRSIPLGYTDFCLAWNNGTAVDDPWQFSTTFISDDPQDNGVVPSKYPVRLSEIFITPEQTGIVPINDQPSAVQAEINQEYTAMMAAKQRRLREFIEERKAKRPPHYTVYMPPPRMSNNHNNRGRGRSQPKFRNNNQHKPFNNKTTTPSQSDNSASSQSVNPPPIDKPTNVVSQMDVTT
jgi:hypothetical protein